MADTDVGYRLFVGIDIAADTFTAAWRASGGEGFPPYTGEQTPTGRAGLQQRLHATGLAPDATLVVLEATGPYWVALALGLHEAGYRVAVVNPRQAHHFAKAQLRRANGVASFLRLFRNLDTAGEVGASQELAAVSRA